MLALELLDHVVAFAAALKHGPIQVGLFLRLMHAHDVLLDVVEDLVEQPGIRLVRRVGALFAQLFEQHRQLPHAAMLVADDLQRLRHESLPCTLFIRCCPGRPR